MKIKKRIEKLRNLMTEKNIDAYIISSSDPHLSEYVAPRWASRKWISGFTGSAGIVVITKEKAGLWTDGRYFIQAEEQLKGSGIDLFKMFIPGYPEMPDWILSELKQNSVVGFDGSVFSLGFVRNLEKKLKSKQISINIKDDLLQKIWEDRPAIPDKKIFEHKLEFAGLSRVEKLKNIRLEMKNKGIDYYLVTALDEIAWLFNIRGNDVLYNPVAYAFSLISIDNVTLFIDKQKIPSELYTKLLDDNVFIKDYFDVYDSLKDLSNEANIFLHPQKTNQLIFETIPKACNILEKPDIISRLKAIKNEIEIENMKKTSILDCVALLKFNMWLDANLGKNQITEITAAEKLNEFRSEIENYVGSSFGSISAYKEHAAMMHYSATKETDYILKKEGMYLIDSGGQYLDGTTDITRTFVLGELTEQQKIDYTLTLKGVIRLSTASFLKGTTGANLDILARDALWRAGIDYKCGSGHGVGFFLNVHEGPQNFSQSLVNVPFEPGMFTTIEPGVYKENQYGIRIENLLLTVQDKKTDFGEFYKFETVTFYPLELQAICLDLLTKDEVNWLKTYNKIVVEKLSPYLSENEMEWLKNKCSL